MSGTGALIPIRLDSARLPGKALLDVSGVSALGRLITQVAACEHVLRSQIVVCTTQRAQDDPLVQAADELGVRVYRGSTDDLIDRLYHAARSHGLDTILQVDGDDICADPGYMTACIDAVRSGDAEVAHSGAGLPLGAGSKAFQFSCLERVFQCYVPGKNDTGFSYFLTKSGMFKVVAIAPLDARHVMSDLRLTLDYPQDLELFRALYGELRGSADAALGIAELCDLVRAQPALKKLNAGLDEGYWQRTRELMSRHPLQMQIGGNTVKLEVDP